MKHSLMSTTLKKYLVPLFFLIIAAGIFTKAYVLQDAVFIDWDEGIYATVSSEILENRSLEATYNYEVWLNKPPLTHYMFAVMFGIFEDNEFAARLLMGTFTFIMLAMVYVLTIRTAKRLVPDKMKKLRSFEHGIVGLLPVLITASATLFLQRMTQLNTDAILAIAWMGYFLFRENYLLRLLFISFGTLTKSLLGLYPLGFEFLMLRKSSFNLTGLVRGALLLLVPLSWHIISYVRFGDYFIKAHVMDQMVKRLREPIELHFGSKLFYPQLLLENLHIFLLLIVAGYILVALKVFDLRFPIKKGFIKSLQDFWTRNWKAFLKVWNSDKRFDYLVFLSPLPFFILLLFVQSRISWYLLTILPLFAMSASFAYVHIKNPKLRYALAALVAVFFLYRFVPAAYMVEVPQDPDHITVAKCIADIPTDSVAYLVSPQERKTRNFLEAAQLYTATSFIYGGLPSLKYYVDQEIEIYYDEETFAEDAIATPGAQFDGVIMSADEFTHVEGSSDAFEQEFTEAYKLECVTDTWSGYVPAPIIEMPKQ